MRTTNFQLRISIVVLLLLCWTLPGKAQAPKIISNGPDKEKLVVVILGDGYTAAEQGKFHGDVQRLISGGTFGNDFFRDNQAEFNVYRVDLVSNSSGVTTQSEFKDSALATVYNGDWNKCWIEDSAFTSGRLDQALTRVPRYDYVIILLNEKGFGGCARGSRL